MKKRRNAELLVDGLGTLWIGLAQIRNVTIEMTEWCLEGSISIFTENYCIFKANVKLNKSIEMTFEESMTELNIGKIQTNPENSQSQKACRIIKANEPLLSKL